MLDHPNGVDVQKYKRTHTTLNETAINSARSVLERKGWEDHFVVTSFHVRKKLGEI